MRRVTILSVLVLALAACGDDRASAPTPDIPQQPTEDSVGPLPNFPGGLQIESAAVAEGAALPSEFTCDGANASPPLAWSGVPEEAQELILVMDDLDAPGGFVHWIVVGIPPEEGSVASGESPSGAQGQNDFGPTGYGGPCPPEDQKHQYQFLLYAISEPSGLGEGATFAEVKEALGDNQLALAILAVTYAR